MFNVSYRKVGGLRFIKLGRLTFMFCVSRRYRDLNAPKVPAFVEQSRSETQFRMSGDGVLVLGFADEDRRL